jgi:DNA-binding LacI/PurR family transcriptional regulator
MFTDETLLVSNVHRLANRLERDIHIKNLSPGDPYLTATEAARMLGVSRSVADRAMLLLVKKNLVVRRRGQGTQVGAAIRVDPAMEVRHVKPLESVLLLQPSEQSKVSLLLADVVFPLVRRHFHNATVQWISLSEQDSVASATKLIDRHRQAGERVGVVAMSCIRPVYAYLAECGVPTVVLGSLYPDQQRILPSINIDHFQVGQLSVECLISRGHRRIAALLSAPGRAGTEYCLNGMLAAIHAVNPLPVALSTHSYLGSDAGFAAQVRQLLSAPDRPSGLILGSEVMAKWVRTIVADLGFSIPGQLDMCYLSESRVGIEGLPCPYVEPQMPVLQILTQAMEMLWQLSQGIALEKNTVIVPVSLHGTCCSSHGGNGEKRIQQRNVLPDPMDHNLWQGPPERRQ